MRPDAVAENDKLKPYKGGNDLLWGIHELDNIDKHRSLFTVAHDFLFTSDWFPGSYWLKTDNPDFVGIESEVEHSIQLEIEEAVSQSQISKTNAMLPTLHYMIDAVDRLILGFRPPLE